jgi:lauroyl/myristoyl acyltransferase
LLRKEARAGSILTGRASVGGRRRPAIRLHDLALLGSMSALMPVAWLLPERHWDVVARATALFGRRRRHEAAIKAAFSEIGPQAQLRIERETRSNWVLRTLQLLRTYRPDGWRPRIELQGSERINAALASRRGVILWMSSFRFNDLVAKIALSAAGHRLTHLSMPEHGGSITSFGLRCINPIWVRAENRYLGKRVMIDAEHPKRATEQLRAALAANGVVSITAIRGASRKPAAIRVLGCRFEVGLGAPLLAHETGARLLPVFTLRDPDGSFRVVVEEEIALSQQVPRIEAATAAAEQLGARIERHIRKAPGQWTWWYMEPIAPDGGGAASQ